MRLGLLLMAAVAWASVASAEGFSCNQHGAVVTLSDGTVYYMGKTCDAAREGGGEGRWWLAASAFVIEIDGQGVRLPFEIDCPDLPACWANG